jgi:hypothetical protein
MESNSQQAPLPTTSNRERHAFSETEQLLRKPLRECGIRHEDVRRDRIGLPILNDKGTTTFIDQCLPGCQHAGCPHAFTGILDDIHRITLQTGEKDTESNRKLENLYRRGQKISLKLLEFDGLASKARRDMPTGMEATKAAAPIVAKFHNYLRSAVENFRAEALEVIQSAIAAET